jgi:Meiotically up-regulated gene 113
MDKDSVTKRIREISDERGGHVGYAAFLTETGITSHWLRAQPWYDGWNNLLQEVGLGVKEFGSPKTPFEVIANAIARLIEREGRWPTDDILRRERIRENTFPSLKVIRPLRQSGELARLIVGLGVNNSEFVKSASIAKEYLINDSAVIESVDERIRGYVYLLRSGRRYKIGKSGDPSRRFREVKLELPEETHQVHSIPTDDPSGIESYWHQRFKNKRVRNTEFFELDASDVQAFKRRKYQ